MSSDSQASNSKSATLTLVLKADGGYESRLKKRISANQWGAILGIADGVSVKFNANTGECFFRNEAEVPFIYLVPTAINGYDVLGIMKKIASDKSPQVDDEIDKSSLELQNYVLGLEHRAARAESDICARDMTMADTFRGLEAAQASLCLIRTALSKVVAADSDAEVRRLVTDLVKKITPQPPATAL